MRDLTPQEFLAKMNHHLATVNKVATSEETFQEMSQQIEVIEAQLENVLSEYKENHLVISDLVESYNKTYAQADSDRSVGSQKSNMNKKSEKLAEITKAKEFRSALDQKILNLRNEKNRIKSSINNFRPQGDAKRRWNNSEIFFHLYKTQVSLYSIVKVELRDGPHTFILLSKDLNKRPYVSDIECIYTGTPIGDACLGKKSGDEFTYHAPNGLLMTGKMLECSLPTVSQLEQVISSQERPDQLESSEKVNPFHLHDTYGTNTSRHRKGG